MHVHLGHFVLIVKRKDICVFPIKYRQLQPWSFEEENIQNGKKKANFWRVDGQVPAGKNIPRKDSSEQNVGNDRWKS